MSAETRLSDTSRTGRFGRRRLLTSAAAGAAGAVALAGCADDDWDGIGIFAPRVMRVRADDPLHSSWRVGSPFTVALGPQDMALPQKLTPTITSVEVRAVHDGQRIGFLLTWDDPDASDLTIGVDSFRDACAVLIGPGTDNTALRAMGSVTTPVTLLHWKADWQRDADLGRQELEAAFPNRSVDVYPPLWNVAPADVDVQAYLDHDASEWLPAIHVDNPVSPVAVKSPVEKAVAYGFGTTTSCATQNATGRGVRTATGWQVAMSRPLDAIDDGEIALAPGAMVTTAFAVWSGSAGDAGSRKQPSVTVHTVTVAR